MSGVCGSTRAGRTAAVAEDRLFVVRGLDLAPVVNYLARLGDRRLRLVRRFTVSPRHDTTKQRRRGRTM